MSVWLSRLPSDRIERRLSHAQAEGGRPSAPRVIVGDNAGAQRIDAMNEAAAALGLKPGMPLADARAMYPALAVDQADTQADQRLLEAICDWLGRYTPLAAPCPPDGITLDIAGCAHLFGGEEAMRRDVVRRLRAQGFTAHAAVAPTVGAAWAIARYAINRHTRNGVIAPEALAVTLQPLPLGALRLDTATLDALARLGLRKIGDITGRPRAPLAARFGTTLLRRLDQAFGQEDEPVSPRLPLPPFIAERCFAEPVTHEAFILEVIGQLAAEVARSMASRGEGARALQVTLYRVDGAVRRLSVATSRPQRDPMALARLFRERFATLTDELDAGFGFEVIRLAVTTSGRMEETQDSIVDGGHAACNQPIDHLVDRLGVRFGLRRVQRLGFAESHIPEYAVVATPAHRGPPQGPAQPGLPRQDCEGPSRPLRLFERPEEIDAIAEVPDGPPARFRWRRVAHEVARAEGPERIAMEWWRDDAGRALTRDYFRVEDHDGRRFWLYREGLFGRETASPRWYVHGLFA